MVTLKFLSVLAITIGMISGLMILAGVFSVTSTVTTAFAVGSQQQLLQLPSTKP